MVKHVTGNVLWMVYIANIFTDKFRLQDSHFIVDVLVHGPKHGSRLVHSNIYIYIYIYIYCHVHARWNNFTSSLSHHTKPWLRATQSAAMIQWSVHGADDRWRGERGPPGRCDPSGPTNGTQRQAYPRTPRAHCHDGDRRFAARCCAGIAFASGTKLFVSLASCWRRCALRHRSHLMAVVSGIRTQRKHLQSLSCPQRAVLDVVLTPLKHLQSLSCHHERVDQQKHKKAHAKSNDAKEPNTPGKKGKRQAGSIHGENTKEQYTMSFGSHLEPS